MSENATFRVDDGRGRALALRFYRPGVRTEAAIRSELTWLEALDRAGTIPVAPPVAAADGSLLQHPGGERMVAFGWVPGREPAEDATLERRFRQLGAIAARLHAQARRWVPPPGFERPRWEPDRMIGPGGVWGEIDASDALDAGARDTVRRAADRVIAALRRHGTGADRFGLIHADLRPANVLADGDALTVIDFDDCGWGWFGYDAAACASFLEDRPALPALLRAWCEGYRTVAPFGDEAMLPTMVMLRRLLLTAWVASHPEAGTARRLGPGFVRDTVRLAQRFLDG